MKRHFLSKQSLSNYIIEQQRVGRYWFTKEQAIKNIQTNALSFKQGVARLIKNKKVARIKRDFFVIVPPEYYQLGVLPAEWFIDAWMSYAKRQYYVGLLTGAALHGAAHQQPQEFQVIVDKTLPTTLVGKLSIRYFKKNNISKTSIQKIKTNTGYMNVSTPESTAIDLIQFMKSAGGLNNVATVLKELTEKIDPDKLLIAIEENFVEFPTIQRLGFILDAIGEEHRTKELNNWILNKTPRYVLLCPYQKKQNFDKNRKWKILINEILEIDV